MLGVSCQRIPPSHYDGQCFSSCMSMAYGIKPVVELVDERVAALVEGGEERLRRGGGDDEGVGPECGVVEVDALDVAEKCLVGVAAHAGAVEGGDGHLRNRGMRDLASICAKGTAGICACT